MLFCDLRAVYLYLFIHHKYLLNAYYLPNNLLTLRRLNPCPHVALGWRWKSKLALGCDVREVVSFIVSIFAVAI